MLNLRCLYCQTPFTVGRAEMLSALISMDAKGQNHYDAHCPRCRRANSISRQRMELFYPNWREAAKQEAKAAVVAEKPAKLEETEPIKKAKKPAAKAKPATEKKPSAKKPAAEKKTAVKKTTTKTSKTSETKKK
ncbi:MAG: hypothetical protein LC099_03425 [Anaerolineales bacterium]|nr:hypothetical protein [Anaerolineales bacterium]